MTVTHIQTSFSYGEVSPRLLARVDLEAFNKATKTMENAYPFLHGGCRRRPGSLFVGETINATENVKLIPFVYSNTKSFVLVFNANKIEFVTNGGFVTSGAPHYSITSPYSSADLAELSYAQAGNVMFFAHPKYPPKQLVRVTDTSWVLSDITVTARAVSDYFFENFAIRFKLLSGSFQFQLGQTFTIITDGMSGITSFSNVIGGTAPTAGTSYGVLAAITASALAPAETWTLTCAYVDKERSEWTVTGSVSGSPATTWCANNYPSAVTFFEQRLWFAGSTLTPQKIWSSQTVDWSNFTLGPRDTDACAFTIASDTFDKIMHLVPTRQLLPLTYGSEYSLQGSVNNGITPSSVRIVKQTRHGSTNAKPINIGQEVIFTQRDALKLRALSYSVTEDANVAPDITLFSEHITNSGIKTMAFAQSPDYIAWMTKNNGDMLTLTLARDYDTIGWARQTTDGDYEHVVCIPQGTSDDVYVSVIRTINGVQKRYIEIMDYFFETYSDAAVVKSNVTKQTVWTGLGHLENKTVDIVADGLVHGQRLVTGGSITLDYPANEVRVGLHYDTTLELLHPELGNITDSSQGRKVSLNEIVLRFQDTIGCRINGYDIPFRKSADGLDSRILPFTGDKSVLATGWRSPNNIKIQQLAPMPFTLLGAILKATVTN